jgi:hypothetical protein
MDPAEETNQQKMREARLEDILKEVGNGKLTVTIVNEKIVGVPKQRIEAPTKHGIRRELSVDDPIRLIA